MLFDDIFLLNENFFLKFIYKTKIMAAKSSRGKGQINQYIRWNQQDNYNYTCGSFVLESDFQTREKLE